MRRASLRKRRWRSQAGVAAVEFALILPIFLILLLGMMEYGYLYFVHLNMTNAAREGARVGVTQDSGGVVSGATLAAQRYLTAAGVQATINPPTFDGTTLTVTISQNYQPLIGFVPTPPTLQASASMRWELAPPP
jgi:Flp pilus assembly protein TadG